MKKKVVFLALLSGLFLLAPSYGTPEISPKALGKNLKKHLGEQVQFTDELLHLWKKQPLKKKDKSGYIKFETRYVRCILRESATSALVLIHERMKKISPQVLTFYGTVIKKEEFQYFVEISKVEHPKYLKEK